MDQFFLQLPPQPSNFQLQHGDGILLIGSCFSDEIAARLKAAGHQVLSNPHGTIFHPAALAHNLMDAFNEELDHRIVERDGRFYSWNTNTLISGESKEALQNKLSEIKTNYREQLKSAKMLIVTLGTAWAYELKETNEVVANCHKMNAALFEKFLSSPYEIVQDWVLALEQIQAINPELQVVFTVSPVRHIKDGIIENNLSKARLIEGVHQLSYENNCHYFPSYELILDVLRDYRFFKTDKIHPTEEAIDFVWQHFEQTYFTDKTIKINRNVEKVNKLRQHKPLTDASSHSQLIQEKMDELKRNHSDIQLNFY